MDAGIHPRVARAAEGELPEWTRAGADRRAHMTRVAALLDEWAEALDLDRVQRLSWRAQGFLHDALRDAGAAELRAVLEGAGADGEGGADRSGPWRVDWSAFALVGEGVGYEAPPTGTLHGPAAALKLVREGVRDPELLGAVAYHTAGHPGLGPGGRALYCADYLEPGRPADDETRAGLRARYPEDPEGVLRDVLRDRMRYHLEEDRPIFLGTVRLWNQSSL